LKDDTRKGTRTGLEVFLSDHLESFRGRSIGLLANPTSVNRDLIHAMDLIQQAGLKLSALFGPEHGIRGDAQDMIGVETAQDPKLKIPVYSL
jgi:uncharacterized protein YbbC (DUF1343 family)